MIDSHAHLYWEDYQQDFDAVIQRALDAGLTHIINIGVDLKTSKKALKQAQQIKQLKVYCTIGIHPGDYLDSPSLLDDESIHKMLKQLEQLYRGAPDKIKAVGECGLDYYFPTNPPTDNTKNQQRLLFNTQIELAKKLHLPLVIHCRDAWEEVFNCLTLHPKGAKLQGVFHCWSGSYQDAQKVLSLGFYISFAGNITYPKAHSLRQIAQLTPLDRILIETDSPFLSPQEQRGRRNEPANLIAVAKTITEVRGISLQQVTRQTSQNTKQLFRI